MRASSSKNGIMFERTTRSKWPSGNSSAAASPTSKLRRPESSGGSFRRASSIIPVLRSTPTTSASGYRSASEIATTPVPVPRSRTCRGEDGEEPFAARVELDPHPGSEVRLLELLPPKVERHVAEAIDDEGDCADPVLSHLRLRNLDPHERLRIERRAELLERDSRSKVR